MPSRTATEQMPQQLYGLPLVIYTLMLRLAATLVGQYFLHLADRILWTVENLTYWSIPPQRLAEITNDPDAPLTRPLSWWLFLPGLLWLRFIRKSLSVALWFVGIEPVTPVSMIHYVQVQRKKIQSIKQSGAKIIRKHREESSKRPGILRALWNKLQKIFCLEKIYYEDGDIKIIPQKSVNNEESEEDVEDETELSLAELLEKYANEEDDEVNDPDYVHNEESSSEDTDGDDDDVEFTDDGELGEEAQTVLNKSFACEPTRSPRNEPLARSRTPPMKEYSKSLHPLNVPPPNRNLDHENAIKDPEPKVRNGTSVDKRKGSMPNRNNQKYRGGSNNRWNFKHNNNVRKPPVITVSGTNNNSENFFTANDGIETLLNIRRILEQVAQQNPRNPKM
ncbi:uncharacterized protein LOC129800682 isoform X2 [Phlebotomus papatasi]|uniref:uncharacterized protein LOC129800682 isoform X2 n=1 Tax=Phlebotomus papatasi TaxID=29031 RepID=UPI0024836670|nr:uncharacterized protein LOC129800682 isoform X2 [Phlebotomus papatasi]